MADDVTGRGLDRCGSGVGGERRRRTEPSNIPDAGQVRRVEVYGKDAVVHLEKDTVFLARFDDGWRVTAAGCTPNGDRPYDCDVRGS